MEVNWGEVSDLSVSQAVEIFGGLLPCKQIIIVDVNGLVCILACFSDEHVEQPFTVEVIDDRILCSGVKNDKTVYLPAACHGFDNLEDFILILPGDYGVYILPLVAELTDAADCFQIKGIFIGLFYRDRKNNADCTGIVRSQVACLEIRLISHLIILMFFSLDFYSCEKWRKGEKECKMS